MERWFVFAHDGYYPLGGLEDCKGIFERQPDAVRFAERLRFDDVYVISLSDILRLYSTPDPL